MATHRELVSVYLNEADRWERRPLYAEILKFLQKSGCAGATVLRGLAGFTGGVTGVRLPSPKSKGKLPVVVEFIDVPERVAEILPTLRRMAGTRLITVQSVEVLNP